MNINEIKQALEKATPGPWYSQQVYSNQWRVEASNGVGFMGKTLATVSTTNLGMDSANGNVKNNAHLIANAPTWLSQLLQEREQMVEALNWIADRSTNHLGAITKAEVTLNMVGELE